MPEVDDRSSIHEFAVTGADSIGAGIGAVLGTLIGGPGGTVAGASIGPPVSHALVKAGAELKNRYLSPREDKRVASALKYAIERTEEKIEEGNELRGDGFFGSEIGSRSEADEIVEGALIAAQREHEERKIEHIGYLISNICFDESIGRYKSNVLVDNAERMSWRQITILSYLVGFKRLSSEYRKTEKTRIDGIKYISKPPDDFLHEISDLQRMRIIMGMEVYMKFPFDPQKYEVSDLGHNLHSLMELDRIYYSDTNEVRSLSKLGLYDVYKP